MRQRLWSVWKFAQSVFWLGLFTWMRDTMEFDRQPQWQSSWALSGLVVSLASNWFFDIDACGIRTNWTRRIAVTATSAIGGAVLFRNHGSEQFESTIGWNVATACYRLRYGILGAPRGPDS